MTLLTWQSHLIHLATRRVNEGGAISRLSPVWEWLEVVVIMRERDVSCEGCNRTGGNAMCVCVCVIHHGVEDYALDS